MRMETVFEGLHRLIEDHLRENPVTNLIETRAYVEYGVGRHLKDEENKAFTEVIRDLEKKGHLLLGDADIYGDWVEMCLTEEGIKDLWVAPSHYKMDA